MLGTGTGRAPDPHAAWEGQQSNDVEGRWLTELQASSVRQAHAGRRMLFRRTLGCAVLFKFMLPQDGGRMQQK